MAWRSGEAPPGLAARLVGPVRRVWAKHERDSDGWLPLWRHMADSAAVAGLLWDTWLPANLRALIAEALPDGEADGRRLVSWLAAVHDIGKATPAFACQVDGLADTMRDAQLDMRTYAQYGPDRRLAPHGLAGQVLLGEWLVEKHGWNLRHTGQFTVVVGGHHGVPPESLQVRAVHDHPELLRTPGPSEPLWGRVQTELLDACAEEYGIAERLTAWQTVKLPQPVQALLTAVVIMADWIASNPDFFPYFPDAAGVPDEKRVEAGWAAVDLPAPWAAGEPPAEVADLFAARFRLPPGAVPRSVQAQAVYLARRMERPGLMVIEAPMGEGKTEAALAAAEILAARSGAGGVFFALPTMATSNGMFPRLLRWLDRLPSPSGTRLSVQLAHSKAALNKDFDDVRRGRWGRGSASVDMDGERSPSRGPGRAASAELVAHQWLRGRKKAMLASFVAGTIDQLLFAGLKSRHLVLRHLGVAGKVVVIDEAHAYDTYMSVYLDRVLSWLGAYRVPVVVLSATLPADRRRQLAEAYAGVPGGAPEFAALQETTDYPLLTAVAPGEAPVVEAPAASDHGGEVVLERLDDDVATLADRLAEEKEGGGCVLVVRNTVRRVLDTARVLRERFGDDVVTVAHSRFIDVDRAANDADLLARFGPPGEAGGERPSGLHIVVASQVAEQSLDVDFDLLVTDLCPVDLLLQRIGRLHRHRRPRPERLAVARCLVTGADWGDGTDAPAPVRGSVAVYGAYALLRSAAVLLPHLDGGRPVRLPGDISPLVQAAYGDGDVGPAGWAGALAEAGQRHEKRRREQEQKASVFRLGEVGRPGRSLIGWIAAGVGDADDSPAGQAQVRDGRPAVEVLVVRRRDDGTLTTLPWLDKGAGLELPVDRVPPLEAALAAARCGLRLPIEFSDPEVTDRAIAELEETWVKPWQGKESPWLDGQLILQLDEDCRTRLAGFSLHYSERDGLEVTRD
ncbi:CRISPR-associated helicase Cas3' [Streptomyces sp. RFCAC02]|uniref:CRISPR-associated helicase Cas3' n=1 Tax=Streptomyces sp. RFCAC02 TaxID=2499143 RepID=UPI00143D37F5|nr:CRISPR-associated helicase Cas3' [Streptomyces sp. RFCAC02]